MKFHEWFTKYESAKKDGDTRSWNSFYSDAANEFRRFIDTNRAWLDTHKDQFHPDVDRIIQKSSRLNIEHYWYQESRPYYKAWPAIMRAVMGIKLDVSPRELAPQQETATLVRFVVGHELESRLSGGCCVESVLFGSLTNCVLYVIPRVRVKSNGNTISGAVMRFWEVDKTIEDQIGKAGCMEGNAGITEIECLECVRLACRACACVLLMKNDPSIVTPDVLSKDRDEYDRTTDEAWKERAVERACRRGVVGWNIGADYEVCPHYRRPHFGLRHTGKGGTVPRIVPIKGAVVHRSRLTEVPTGYMLPDGTEIEHGEVVTTEV